QEIQTPWKIILALFIIMLLSLIFFFKLKTTIDTTGISARFGGGNIFFRQYKWQEISECYVREYRPLTEYGGWGIRGIGKPEAYTTSGKYGIQIISISGEQFLIGTQKPDEVKVILKNYQQKLNS
ncbi:MAG TPA: hypothetical protein VFM59_06345, partial [Salinimicrobium sp.]|nr:hypothetical protein [Salinimicrobium sp.]